MVPSATLTIRTGTPTDLSSLVAIDTFARSHSERVESLSQSLVLGQCVVAASEAEPAGFAILNYSFFGFGFIPLVVVVSAQRRQGIGLRLLETLERRCTSAKLFSSANLSNVAAQHLFARAGFVESGRVENLDPGDPEVIYFKAPSVAHER
jgi:ribosomal protein S18 acetylase RimI-like enzyme